VASAPDTTPSRDAQAVLATIPEPLAPGERIPPPATVPPTLGDTAGAAAEADTGSAEVPVPAPTPVLGERALPEVVAPADTTARPLGPPPAALQRPAPAGRETAAGPDTCWRIQVAAPAERAKAERYLAAAQSQLLVPMAIEKERGLFKVRTRDCLDGGSADALRRRASQTGFDGAFRFPGRRP
jgi:hypothetical protein